MNLLPSPAAFAVAALVSLPFSPAVQAETLRVIVSWPSTLGQVSELLPEFQRGVTEATGGAITFHNSGPEVIPPFEQLEPLSQGVFDLHYGSPTYHQAQTGVGAVIDGLLKTDPEALRASGVMDFINDYYRQNFGVEVLALFSAPQNQFVLRAPLSENGRLDGLKIRTVAAFEGLTRALGGSPVAMAAAEAYAAIERGVIDGAAWPIHAAADYRLYEVADYITRPGFGHTSLVLMVNAARFDALPEEHRTILREQARALEQNGAAFMAALAESQTATMLENGVEIVEFPPEVASEIGRNYFEGTLALARNSQPAAVDALVEFARSAGMMLDQE